MLFHIFGLWAITKLSTWITICIQTCKTRDPIYAFSYTLVAAVSLVEGSNGWFRVGQVWGWLPIRHRSRRGMAHLPDETATFRNSALRINIIGAAKLFIWTSKTWLPVQQLHTTFYQSVSIIFSRTDLYSPGYGGNRRTAPKRKAPVSWSGAAIPWWINLKRSMVPRLRLTFKIFSRHARITKRKWWFWVAQV